jgi:hypothetical protein
MSAFHTATKFFEACEAPLGWDGCAQYVQEGAGFSAQSEPLADIDTVQGYCDWMHGFGTVTSPEGSYELHSASFDDNTNTAVFFATYHGKHTGEGGPVPPTNMETRSHYVYVLKMGEDGKVAYMTKIWNAPWAMRELGWT